MHAGVGDGSLANAVKPALIEARKKGVVIVRSSRVGSGIVARNGEANDDELDFVADGVTVVRVPRSDAEWVLRSRNGTHPGARRSRSPLAALSALRPGRKPRSSD